MTPPISTAPLVPTPSQPVAELRLSPEELNICEKWIMPYSVLETVEDRLKIWRGKILPCLFLLNTGIPEEAWKTCKLVSVLHDRELNRILTNETAN